VLRLLEKGAKVCYEKPRCSVTHAARSAETTLASTIKVCSLEELDLSPDDYEVAPEEYEAESPVDLRLVRVAREREPTPRVGPSSPFGPGLRLGEQEGWGLFRGRFFPTMRRGVSLTQSLSNKV
jgi:hypothetical protein